MIRQIVTMAHPSKVLDVKALKVAVSNPGAVEQEFNAMDVMMATADDIPANVAVKNRCTCLELSWHLLCLTWYLGVLDSNVLPSKATRVPLTRIGTDTTSEVCP